MTWVYKYDGNFIWQPGGEIEIDLGNGQQIPEGYTLKQPTDGLYIAKYDPVKDEWFETATQEYIDSFQPTPIPPSDITLLKQQNALLSKQVALLSKDSNEGKIRESKMAKQIAQSMMELEFLKGVVSE